MALLSRAGDTVGSPGIQREMKALRKLADRLVEPTVVLSYTSLGYRLRQPLWDATVPDLHGKVAVVTGANSGIGLAACTQLACRGATVIMAVRNEQRGEHARQRVLDTSRNERVFLELVDVADMGSVRAFADRIGEQYERLDVLLHNAGVLLHERTTNAAGVETTFATHVLGPFVMTHRLRPLLARSAPSRVITVTSGGMYTTALDVDDLQSARGDYDGVMAYARCKRAQVMLTELWADHYGSDGIHFHAMHPGWADTPGVLQSLPRFHRVLGPILRSPDQGADTAVWLAASREAVQHNGLLWFDREPRRTHVLPFTKGSERDRDVLWSACMRLGGLTNG
ncbi:MAG: SDR family NAD(P)-dependent oxidoreductase [Myxococcota bacterium]